jgi:S-(hydroxymethyl)glutathione dehydrogenase/alcohol dehydrogenase
MIRRIMDAGGHKQSRTTSRIVELCDTGQLKLDEVITREYALGDNNQGCDDMRART